MSGFTISALSGQSSSFLVKEVDNDSGTYIPTITLTANPFVNLMVDPHHYSRTGDIVSVTGSFRGTINVPVPPTAAIEFEVSLPISSAFTSTQQASGLVTATIPINNNIGTSKFESGTTTALAKDIRFIGGPIANGLFIPVQYSFQYEVIS